MRYRGLPHSLTLCLIVVTVSAGTSAAARLFSAPPACVEGEASQPPAQTPARAPIIGRWDLTVQGPKSAYPSWLEVSLSGTRTLVGRFVGGGGSARPISRVDFNDGAVHFAIPPQWEKDTSDLVVDAVLTGDVLEGTLVTPAGERHRFTGRRAPSLRRGTAPVWGEPVSVFSGTDLTGWTAFGGTSQWTATARRPSVTRRSPASPAARSTATRVHLVPSTCRAIMDPCSTGTSSSRLR